jgi:hypothetical protein
MTTTSRWVCRCPPQTDPDPKPSGGAQSIPGAVAAERGASP